MNRQPQPYNTFMFSTIHFDSTKNSIPAKARKQEIIDARHGRRYGTLRYENQRIGIEKARLMLDFMKESDQRIDGAHLVGILGVGSTFHQLAEGEDVMNKKVSLATLASDENDDFRQNEDGIWIAATGHLAEMSDQALTLTDMHNNRLTSRDHYQSLGRRIGATTMELACVGIGNTPEYLSEFEAQALARDRALHIANEARQYASTIGSNPSFAQLADRDSDVSIDVRRNAPRKVAEAFEFATEQYPHAA
ncbi:MAG: hypothetical protein EOO17_04515 [Chloroflexi bacterium]|nr:MAG: hypothetical protein EOO17_04515 [Chloroflexota bacterium]